MRASRISSWEEEEEEGKGPGDLKYYYGMSKKYLEGREFSEELIDYVVSHENKWLRNVFRNYIQYLYQYQL